MTSVTALAGTRSARASALRASSVAFPSSGAALTETRTSLPAPSWTDVRPERGCTRAVIVVFMCV